MLAWLCCTPISHIFHDCVGYCTANHMCYPLSCAVAMATFFPSLGYCRIVCNTLSSHCQPVHAILCSSLGYTTYDISLHELASFIIRQYASYVCFACTLNLR